MVVVTHPLIEYVPQLGEYAVLHRLRRLDVRFILKALKCCAFLIGEIFGDVDHHVDKLIAHLMGLRIGQTFATQAQYLAWLCSGGDFQTGASADCRHIHRVQRSGCRA